MSTLKRYVYIPTMWLTMAVIVGMISLLSAHTHQTQASTLFPSPTPQDAPQHPRPLLDAQYPGSVAYLALRVQDRVQQVLLRPEELPVVFLNRSQQRLDAARYAWEQGDHERALSAVHKAHVYLHRSQKTCQEFPGLCEDMRSESEVLSRELQASIQTFHTECGRDDYQVALSGLSQSIDALGFSQ